MNRTPHKQHRPRTDPIGVYSYRGPISDAARPNPRAHGNVTVIERCSCGATRAVNVNTLDREVGPWEI